MKIHFKSFKTHFIKFLNFHLWSLSYYILYGVRVNFVVTRGYNSYVSLFCILNSEEEISAMRKELEKYGIQMPAFSKIGGILESEVERFPVFLKVEFLSICCQAA